MDELETLRIELNEARALSARRLIKKLTELANRLEVLAVKYEKNLEQSMAYEMCAAELRALIGGNDE